MIIDRYIVRELSGPFFLGVFILTFVFLINKLIRLMDMLVNRGVGLGEILALLGYILPAFLALVIPITVLLAALLGFGRLAADSELTALLAGGVSFYRLLRPVWWFSFAAFLVTGWLTLYLLPRANLRFKQTLYTLLSKYALVNIRERVFVDDLPGMVMYVDEVSPDGTRFKGVIISDSKQMMRPCVVVARAGRVVADPGGMSFGLELEDGSIQELEAGEKFHFLRFGKYRMRLDLSRLFARKKRKREREMTLAELQKEVRRRKERGGDFGRFAVEWHKRFAIPFAALLLGVVGACLGMSMRTGSRAAGFAVCLVIVFLYYILLRTGESLGEAGVLPAVVAVWTPNGLLAIVGGYLLRRVGRIRRR